MAGLQDISTAETSQFYELRNSVTRIGRDPQNDVVVSESDVSRDHAEIRYADGRWWLRDLSSRNGTFCNAAEVKGERELKDGDRVRICDTVLCFVAEPNAEQKSSSMAAGVQAGPHTAGPGDTATGAITIDGQRMPVPPVVQTLAVDEPSSTIRMRSNLESKHRAIVELVRIVGNLQSLDDVLAGILQGACGVFPQMAAGAVLLQNTDSDTLVIAATHTRNDRLFRPAASRTVARAAMDGAQGILSVEPEKDERFGSGSSVNGLKMDSMMCVPLRAPRGDMIGALQIDTRDTGPKFTEADLDVLVSVALLAAMSIENARLHDDLESRISERTRQYSEALEELRQAHDELEERVAQRTADLQRSNDDLQQFAYVVSHDLKAPLRTVASFSQLLKRSYGGGVIDDQADKWLGFVENGALHMDALIDDLLILSRIATRGGPSVETDTQKVFNKTQSLLQTVIAESGATVTSDPLPTVRVDGMQLLQLLQNLIENSIRFRGDDVPQIHVAACQASAAKVAAPDDAHWPADTWLFSVCDNGIGIDPEAHRRVFEIFQRLHRQEDIPGNGIGLAVCRKIVERHGGRIWVESEPGRGSTFWFYFSDQPEELA